MNDFVYYLNIIVQVWMQEWAKHVRREYIVQRTFQSHVDIACLVYAYLSTKYIHLGSSYP